MRSGHVNRQKYDWHMEATDSILQQIERALRKVATKFPLNEEQAPLTDILIQVKQESGELLVFNDDDVELTRCVVEEWIDNKDDDFYEAVQPILKKAIAALSDTLDNLNILKPYSFVLIDEDRETVADLYLVDDDTLIIDSDLMKGMEEDLNAFLENLLKK